MGHENAEVIDLVRDHCRLARVEAVHGNSVVGEALGVPMGLLELRCEHASPAVRQGHNLLPIAVKFYEENCVGCVHREGGTRMPNLATKAAEWAAQRKRVQDDAERRAADRAARHRQRQLRRQAFAAGESHVVRNLVGDLDRIDRLDLATATETPEDRRAARHVFQTARAAPVLFTPVLVDTLLELATDMADPTAIGSLRELVRAGRCPPRRALEAAIEALRRIRSPHAGDLVALLEADLVPADLPAVIDQLVDLTCAWESVLWRRPVAPAGLLAAARVDLTLVTDHVVSGLADDDERRRQVAADAARFLLADDPSRLIAFGAPLVASVRGEDSGYAGEPHPSRSAVGALEVAWRSDPVVTRSIIESGATSASEEVRSELVGVASSVLRRDRGGSTSDAARQEAVAFLVQRAGGDWGDEAANDAAESLEHTSRWDQPLTGQVDALIGHLLASCGPTPGPQLDGTTNPSEKQIRTMEAMSKSSDRNARRRQLAKAVGYSAASDPEGIVGRLKSIFETESGDPDYDRVVRATILEALEAAVSADTIRDILPIVYSALLGAEAGIRRSGIDLWSAASKVVATGLPDELTDLAPALLADEHVVVHRRMLKDLPRLGLPSRLAVSLIDTVAGWVGTYVARDQQVVADGIWSLRYLASRLDDPDLGLRYESLALASVRACLPRDRERLLTARWSSGLRASPLWVTLALDTQASPELQDYYNRRREPLLAALFDDPGCLDEIPFDRIEGLSSVHGPYHPWRALEVVELLQSSGRWSDAETIAMNVETAQPPGSEGEPGRQLAGCVARGAALLRLGVDGADLPALTTAADALRAATNTLVGSRPDMDPAGAIPVLVDSLVSQADALSILAEPVLDDPINSAERLERAADVLEAASATKHAAAKQRAWLSEAWRICALFLRYDEQARKASPEATLLVQAAVRRAQVLAQRMSRGPEVPVPDGLEHFLEAAAVLSSPSEVDGARKALAAVTAPVNLVGDDLVPDYSRFGARPEATPPAQPLAVCVLTLKRVPVTDVLIVRPREIYTLGLTVRLLDVPDWAETCVVEPVSTLGRDVVSLPRFELQLADGVSDLDSTTLSGEARLHCDAEQPVRDPAIDCPLVVRLAGNGKEQVVEVAGCTRLRIRPFDPSRDGLTAHGQTDARLLEMFGCLDATEFDTEDARAFCRLFAASVRAAQHIMFEKTFMKGTKVTEAEFHDELETHLRADPELGGRLTRRDPVAGGFDDLLHDDVINELKVNPPRSSPATVDKSVKYLGQPTQYGVGRGSQLSVLVVLDQSAKESPPGVIDNYIGWLRPKLHGLEDARYPSLVGVLIINANLPLPSGWRRPIPLEDDNDPER